MVDKKSDSNYGNIWKVKYDQQADINTRLEMQLVEMNSQLEQIKNDHGNKDIDGKMVLLDDISLLELRQTLDDLKKCKTELEWSICENEWRLNKEGKLIDQAESRLKELQTRLNETNSKIVDNHQKKVLPPLVGGAISNTLQDANQQDSC